jgi:putative flippase GtrA
MENNSKRKDALREIAVYLIFGVLTTVVAMATYFGTLWFGEYKLNINPDAAEFNMVRIVAEVLQWIMAVLFAFFTNKKWVFKDADTSISTGIQLLRFSSSRLATLGLDALITLGTVWILQAISYETMTVLGIGITADLIAKLLASVAVVISNYILSKLFVFKANNGEK